MPSSLVRCFSDPSEYMACLRWTKAEVVVTEPGRFASKLTQIALPSVSASRYSETLRRVVRSHHPHNRALFGFSTQSGPTWFAGTAELTPNALIRFSEGESSFHRSTGESGLATVSLPLEDVEALASSIDGRNFMPPRNSVIVTPNPAAMVRLQKIHAMAGDLAEHAPDVIAVPEAARGLEEALLTALAGCLGIPDGKGNETGSRRRTSIMKRFYALLEAHPDGVLQTLDVCKAIGTSNRTLVTCCQETLGIGPRRYLKLRQMQLVRRALALADPALTTVTEIATAHGFWELGRFSVAYGALFGERPSTTLRRRPGDDEYSMEFPSFPATFSEIA